MLVAGMAFLLGVTAVQLLAALPPAGWLPLAVFALVPLFMWRRTRTIAWLVAGLTWMLAHAHWRLAEQLPRHLEGVDLSLIVEIAGPTRGDQRYVSFAADVLSDDHGGAIPRHLRLGWYGRHAPLSAGQQWRLVVRLKRPHGTLNPGGFDRERWLFMRGWRATGYVREAQLLRDAGTRRWLTRWRHGYATRVAEAGYRHASLLNSLTVGVRDSVTASEWAVLRATGTTHLLAISGLHIGLLALAGNALGSLVWRASLPLQRCINRPAFAAWTAFAGASLYAAMAGFSVPTQRALIMLAVVLATVILRRPLRAGAGLGLALIGVLIWDPWASLSPGFWLSFAAVAGIAYLIGGRITTPSRTKMFAKVQWGLPLLLAPLVLGFFDQAPWLAGLANLVAVPVVSLVVLPAALLGTLAELTWAPATNLALQLADWSMGLLWRVLAWLAAVPHAELGPATRSLPAGIAGLIGCGLLLTPRGLAVRALGLAFLAPLLFPAAPRPAPDSFRLHLLDVGQGQSVVVETANHVLVYDTGVRISADFDMGSAVVVPFLRALGHNRLDALVVSHGDRDHAGGVAGVVAGAPPAIVYTSAAESISPNHRPLPCSRGHNWSWDGVRFEFLHPSPQWRGSDNNRSCVLRISVGERAALLPGDIEFVAEREILAAGVKVSADILLVGHHGSATSTSSAFLAAVDPRYALYSVGYRNRFNFPSRVVDQRLERNGAERLRSDASGTITLTVDARGVSTPRRYRDEIRRYWHALD